MESNEFNICTKFIADGNCRNFNFTFKAFAEDNIAVYVGNEVQDKNYTITINKENEGGEIMFNMAPQSGKIVTIIRQLPIKRNTDFKEGGPFRASKVNLEFDYQLACLEQVSEKLERVICRPPYYNDVDLSLPEGNAGKAIVWSEDGQSLKNSDVNVDEMTNYFDEKSKKVDQGAVVVENLINDIKQNLKVFETNAKEWASKTDGMVVENGEEVDYSAKHYAEQIKDAENNILQIMEGKADKNLWNTDVGDYIIETFQLGSSWYRKYRNGWVDQGGEITSSMSTSSQIINLLVPYTTTGYKVSVVGGGNLTTGASLLQFDVTSRTRTSFTLAHSANKIWVAKGY